MGNLFRTGIQYWYTVQDASEHSNWKLWELIFSSISIGLQQYWYTGLVYSKGCMWMLLKSYISCQEDTLLCFKIKSLTSTLNTSLKDFSNQIFTFKKILCISSRNIRLKFVLAFSYAVCLWGTTKKHRTHLDML